MAKVEVYDGELIDRALKRFKKQCENEGILQEVRKREFFMKPSEKRNAKKREALRKMAKARRKQERRTRHR